MKLYKIAVVATLALVLTGCATNQGKSKTYQNESKASLNSKDSHSVSNSNNHFSAITSKLNHQMANVILPQSSGLSTAQTVNVKTTSNSQTTKINYYLDRQALPLNSAKISKNIYANFTKKTYNSTSAAKQAVNFQPASSVNGLPKVNLGHSIIGRTQSGAGQEYISWHEGRWSISVHGSRVNHTDPKATAVSAVNLFEKYALPVPETVGTIAFSAGDSTNLSQTITFQKGKQVYTLKANIIGVAIKMAASIK